MKVNGKQYRTIWVHPQDSKIIQIIDQRFLPHELVIADLKTVDDVVIAIKDMLVRGAGLIGATAGYGMYLAAIYTENFNDLISVGDRLKATRPTAVNLAWAVDRQLAVISHFKTKHEQIQAAFSEAEKIADEDADMCKKIGEHGLKIIEEISRKKKGDVVNILTHCNAGWLAFADYGSATSPVYAAYDKGINVHIYVDETRPRNQGASLTAWELGQHGVPHTVITDNTGGLLMQHNKVDMVITGADRVTYTGDAANKIGTYLKALAAKDNNIPFYIALPSSTFDWKMVDGVKEIPIEEREGEEVKYVWGVDESSGKIIKVLITPKTSNAANYGFDVTPRRLITGLITERGICSADQEAILTMYPEHKQDINEGVIKFTIEWQKENFLPDISSVHESPISQLNVWRQRLYEKRLAGVYDNGISFGNLSQLLPDGSFIITGTQTGHLPELQIKHYTKVIKADIEKNSVICKGPIKASSESLTHAALYAANSSIKAVIHVHHKDFWKRSMHHIPTSKADVPYGTPEMAKEIFRLFKETDLAKEKIINMAGHEDGIISFGNDLNEAGNVLFEHFKQYEYFK